MMNNKRLVPTNPLVYFRDQDGLENDAIFVIWLVVVGVLSYCNSQIINMYSGGKNICKKKILSCKYYQKNGKNFSLLYSFIPGSS